ncbi:MAG: hypothetical protein DRQ55_10870 [Planctomycetota bacterium]|nr:MAG: hypothetical protein DRQ55_10870 [Planctomycetota bacterium]
MPSAWIRGAPRGEVLPVVIFESGTPLGPWSDGPEDVAKKDMGSYCVWGGNLYFSASDGSDPRSNGRQYTLLLSDDRFGELHLQRWTDTGSSQVEIAETLSPPEWVSPSEGGRVLSLQPFLEARHPRTDIIYCYEIDSSPEFNSRNLIQSPRFRRSGRGLNPADLYDRLLRTQDWYRPPYRLSALMLDETIGPADVSIQAQRLAFGLPEGGRQVQEIYEYNTNQIDRNLTYRGPNAAWHVLARDAGTCYPMALLLTEMLEEAGYPARLLAMLAPRFVPFGETSASGDHTAAEVFLNDRWHYIDSYFGFFLEGLDADGLDDRRRREYSGHAAFEYAPAGNLSDLSRSERMVTLEDYSEQVLYFDPGSSKVPLGEYLNHELSAEAVPRLRGDQLWEEDQLDLWARVRVVRLSPSLMHRITQRLPVREHPKIVEASPWSVVAFKIDLSSLRDMP